MNTFVTVYEWFDGVTLSWCESLVEVQLECVQNFDALRVSVFADRQGLTSLFSGTPAQVSREIHKTRERQPAN